MPDERRQRPVRVATVPFATPYLDAVLPAGVVRVGPDASPSPWLDPDHLLAHAAEVDVLHLHGGYDHLTVPEMEAWTAAVRRSDVPLVVTVHDLVPREAADGTLMPARHRNHLRLLLATAEVVLTLTPGAADEIADRFGRTAIVVAHPSLAGPTPGIGRETRLVGLHLGRLDPQVRHPLALVRAALSGAVSGGGRLRVDVHPDVDLAARLPELLALADGGELELARSWEPRPEGWVRHLQELHVSVLPWWGGSHSGWVELCRDAGTRAVVPSGGWRGQQWSDVVVYGTDPHEGLDAASLTSAVVAALTRPAPARVDRTWRAEQREAVRRVHAQVYEQVAADHVPA
ncbi:glycosyltransferase [Modestobacter sp. SSW1-42]|uniref:glycosyltransferase n=1 Tax=Modestobacter sp. SSW1-42 TaxID=596372 RepID=UPI003987F8AA